MNANELVDALYEAAAAKEVAKFIAVAGVLEARIDETFVQEKKGQLRRVVKLYRKVQKEQETTPREIVRALETLGKHIKSFTTPAEAAPAPAKPPAPPRRAHVPPPRSHAPPPRAAGPPAARPTSPGVDVEGLRALKRLRDEGVIDDEEFTSKKKKLLGI